MTGTTPVTVAPTRYIDGDGNFSTLDRTLSGGTLSGTVTVPKLTCSPCKEG